MKKDFPTMQELIDYINQAEHPVKKGELARTFGIKGEENRRRLKENIKALKEDPHVKTDGNRFSSSFPVEIELTGRDNHGNFIARPFKKDTDFFQIIVPEEEARKKRLHIGDFAKVILHAVSHRIAEAEVLRKLNASAPKMVGVLRDGQVWSVDRRFNDCFALPDFNQHGLKSGDLIIISLRSLQGGRHQAEFVEKIGSEGDAFSASLLAIHTHSLPFVFREKALKEADKLKENSLENRTDLRELPFVTVDDKEAKDFDDAVYAEQTENGWKIYVAIADVASYVLPDSALDKEALERGNSVYFPDRVIPMLPEKLSNSLCSLTPNTDKSVLVAEMMIDKKGNKLSHRFYAGKIRSHGRLTYDELQTWFDNPKTTPLPLKDTVSALYEAYKTLNKAHEKTRLVLNVPEPVIHLDDKGELVNVTARARLESHQMIEELMILANVAAAEELEEASLPVMYRVHEPPSDEKMENFREAIGEMGLRFSAEVSPKSFTEFLNKHTDIGFVLNELVLRCQSQAYYSPDNEGHFGLNLQKYAHFTSPIRRYADLLVHRALRKKLGFKTGILTENEEIEFSKIAEHISQTERQAMAAEREADERYIAAGFKDKIGETFEAVVADVTDFGLFIKTGTFEAEGFVPRRLAGSKEYHMGDKVSVILKECTPLKGGLLFQIEPSHKKEPKSPKQRKADKKARRKKIKERNKKHRQEYMEDID